MFVKIRALLGPRFKLWQNFKIFLALSVHLSLDSLSLSQALNLHLLASVSSWWLQDDFRMLGWLQDDFRARVKNILDSTMRLFLGMESGVSLPRNYRASLNVSISATRKLLIFAIFGVCLAGCYSYLTPNWLFLLNNFTNIGPFAILQRLLFFFLTWPQNPKECPNFL